MVFDVWRYVFVVRMCACQRRLIWMWLRIIPVKQVFTLPDLIAIASDCARRLYENEVLPYMKTIAVWKFNVALHNST